MRRRVKAGSAYGERGHPCHPLEIALPRLAQARAKGKRPLATGDAWR